MNQALHTRHLSRQRTQAIRPETLGLPTHTPQFLLAGWHHLIEIPCCVLLLVHGYRKSVLGYQATHSPASQKTKAISEFLAFHFTWNLCDQYLQGEKGWTPCFGWLGHLYLISCSLLRIRRKRQPFNDSINLSLPYFGRWN